ncbi:DUF4865 family protein [Streptomyces sp. TRM72054]|nr:DUF4865 family protein [Streptomyces sp. TRM72054]
MYHHSVRQWTGLAYEEGGAVGGHARVAVRRSTPVPEGVVLSDIVGDAVREAGRPAAEDGAVCAAAAVDTARWELVHFSLWADHPAKVEGEGTYSTCCAGSWACRRTGLAFSVEWH